MRQNRLISVAFVASGATCFIGAGAAPATCGTRSPSGAGGDPGHQFQHVRSTEGHRSDLGPAVPVWVRLRRPGLTHPGGQRVPADGLPKGRSKQSMAGWLRLFRFLPSVTAQHSGKRSPKVARQAADVNSNLVSPQIGSQTARSAHPLALDQERLREPQRA
jgi:hypothetical protein